MSSFDLGDVVVLNFTVSVGTVLTDPTAITLTITLPDNTTVSPTPIRDSVGTFHYNYTPAAAGVFFYRWVTTGVGQSSEDGSFTVKPPYTTPVALADAKAFLGKTLSVDDGELKTFVDSAVAIITRHVGPLVPVTYTEAYDGGRDSIVLRKWPAIAIVSLTYPTGGTVLTSDLDLDTDSGVLYLRYGTIGPFFGGRRSVTITYTAGRVSLPEDLRDAVMELTKHLWESQRGGNTRPNFTNDGVNSNAGGNNYLLPYRVESLIASHRTPRIA